MTLQKTLSEVAFFNPFRLSLLVVAVATISSAVPAAAQQKIPTLLEVPAAIATAQPSLVARRAALVQERNGLREGFANQNAQCSAVDERDTAKVASCTDKKQTLQAALERHIQDREVFNRELSGIIVRCKALSDQLTLDTMVIERQGKNATKVLGELEKWTADNEQAWKDALKVATSALMGATGRQLLEKANSARSFLGWMTRYKKQLAEKNIPFEALRGKIERSAHGYVEASISLTSGKAIAAAKKLEDVRELTKKEIAVVASAEEKSDASIREILEDRQIKSLLATDNATADFLAKLTVSAFDTAEAKRYLGKIAGPVAELVNFIEAYGYDAIAWNESRKLILQQNAILEEDLRVIDVLKKQQMCTVQKLEDCRAGNVIRECSSKN